jgi:hypothetical protein
VSEKAKPVYVPGWATERQAPFGVVLRLRFPVDKMVAFLREHANAKGYVNVEVSRRREVSQDGDTHTMKLDTWEPKAKSDATGYAGDAEDLAF